MYERSVIFLQVLPEPLAENCRLRKNCSIVIEEKDSKRNLNSINKMYIIEIKIKKMCRENFRLYNSIYVLVL